MADIKATTISLKSIASSVGPAVAAALKKHNIKAGGSLVLNPGILAGPLLEPTVDLKVAQQIAEEVANGMQQHAAGLAATATPIAAAKYKPGVFATNDFILCGVRPYEIPMLTFGD